MPRKKQITKCRAASGCGYKVLEGGCFCADHELLWIAKSGTTSERIRSKHSKMYKQFRRQQEQAQEQRILEASAAWINRMRIGRQAEELHQMLERQQRQLLNGMKMLHIDYETGVDDVYDAALYGFGERAPAGESQDHQRRVVGFHPALGAPYGDRGSSTAADGPADQGQPEVSADAVHRSSK